MQNARAETNPHDDHELVLGNTSTDEHSALENREEILQRVDDVIRVLMIVSEDLASISGILRLIAKNRIQEAEEVMDRSSTLPDGVNAHEELEKDQDGDSSDGETLDDLPIGYEDILHPEGDDDYDTDDAR